MHVLLFGNRYIIKRSKFHYAAFSYHKMVQLGLKTIDWPSYSTIKHVVFVAIIYTAINEHINT